MRHRASVLTVFSLILSGSPVLAGPLQVFYTSASNPAAAPESLTAEEIRVDLVAAAPGTDLREACPDLCVWFTGGEGGAGVQMVFYRRKDGLSRERTVTFVKDAGDAGAIRANLRKVVIIARSVIGETQFDAGGSAGAPAVSVVKAPDEGPAPPAPPRDWLVAVDGGTTFLGTALSINNVTIETDYSIQEGWLASVSLCYLIPSGFTLDGQMFRAGGLSVRAAGGREVLDAGRFGLRVFIGPQVTWYEFYRGEEPGKWVTHVQLSGGATAGVRLYGPVYFHLRADAAISPANVVVGVENSASEKRINNPVFDALAGVAARF
ncbi:MAG: hypothetical protein HY897_00355 [Deltaproteobacteria bacterium]|nr:hypothetical protein [Deltaproteobacteria bacterium]